MEKLLQDLEKQIRSIINQNKDLNKTKQRLHLKQQQSISQIEGLIAKLRNHGDLNNGG